MSDTPTARPRDPHAKDAGLWDPPATLPERDYCAAEVFEIERDRRDSFPLPPVVGAVRGGGSCCGHCEAGVGVVLVAK